MSETCDVLVIGSGAAGLSTAVVAAFLGLKVIVAEKSHWIGGTSAWSGGWLWIPRNPLAIEAGIDEPPEAPLRYLRSEIGSSANDSRVHTFLEHGPAMVRFFRDHTEVDWIDGNRMPDFHETPGSSSGGRSVCAKPYDGRHLGTWIRRLRPPLDLISLWGMGIAAGADMRHFFNATRSLTSMAYVTARLTRHLAEQARYGRGMKLVNGNALIARLMRSALDLGVDLRTNAPAHRLLQGDNRVTGAIIGSGKISATRGVVLAAGGFPHDVTRIATVMAHAPTGIEHRSAAPPENTGDGLRLAETVGGYIVDNLVSPGAWAPVSIVPRKDESSGHFPHLIERAKPGILAVGPDGRRFVNEANSYHDFISALLQTYPGHKTPHAWIVADHRAQRRYGLGWSKPFPFPTGPAVASGYLKRALSLDALARACDLPPEALCRTVTHFNVAATRGEDPDFGRGASMYNRVQGDPEHSPNPALAPLLRAPFYAVRVEPGSLGTFAGVRTDAMARVVTTEDLPIPGLFAVGNDMASLMGGYYPSGGITLGPAMTFGYIAGQVLAEKAIGNIPKAKHQHLNR
ncbi:MAG: FAD-dependent oxidoreductase [Rhizobiaceae bacterium]|nr:FAD-dependent oxidoreductase [Rhizobiaceae bacterium]